MEWRWNFFKISRLSKNNVLILVLMEWRWNKTKKL